MAQWIRRPPTERDIIRRPPTERGFPEWGITDRPSAEDHVGAARGGAEEEEEEASTTRSKVKTNQSIHAGARRGGGAEEEEAEEDLKKNSKPHHEAVFHGAKSRAQKAGFLTNDFLLRFSRKENLVEKCHLHFEEVKMAKSAPYFFEHSMSP